MVSEVLVGEINTTVISHVSYSGVARERGQTKAKSKHIVAMSICIFALVISFVLAIWFGYQGSMWLAFASLGPLFAAFMGVLCIGAWTK